MLKEDLAHAILTSNIRENKLKRVKISEIQNASLVSFITQGSIKFFHILGISTEFLSQNPMYWSADVNYIKGLEVVSNLKVINDGAERGVALMSDYNKLITRNEFEKQCLLRSVHDHRQKFTSCRKSML